MDDANPLSEGPAPCAVVHSSAPENGVRYTLYLGGPAFRSRPIHWLSFFLVSLSPSRQVSSC
jgi:hypothetical protein